MTIPFVSDALNFVRTAIEKFVDVVPTPLKFILFLYILIFFGSLVTGFILDGKYECNEFNNEVILQDVRIHNNCVRHYGDAWALKHDIPREIWDAAYNSSDNFTRALLETEAYSWMGLTLPINFPTVREKWYYASQWIDNMTVENFKDFIGLGNQTDWECTQVYLCVGNDTGTNLGLYEGCTLNDVPEWPKWYEYTKLNSSENAANLADEFNQNPFRVTCSDLSEEGTHNPVFTFYNFEIFNAKLWLLLMVVFIMFWVYVHFIK